MLTVAELVAGDTLHGRALNLGVWVSGRLIAYVLVPIIAFAVPWSLFDGSKLPFWAAALIFILTSDLLAYLFHRVQHSVPFMWALHSLHHSDEHMNVTTTERHFWGDQILKAVTTVPLAALVIHPTGPVVLLNMAFSLWNYVPHANIRLSFGRLSWVLNCPAYHRRHHSKLPEHFNSNFAALFPIWDVLAGSYFRDESYPPTGLDERPANFVETLWWPVRSRLDTGQRGATMNRRARSEAL